MKNILTDLNTEQQQAVLDIQGALLVLAGAGSGKTRVLTQKIAYMISRHISPYEILAVTFTNKAAQEMKERLERLLGEEVVKKLWVGTFHNICGRILRQEIEKYKSEDGFSWKSNFVIYDQSDSLSLIKQALKLENLDEKVYQPKAVQSTISMAKNKLQNSYKFATKARDYRSERIAKIFHRYEQALASNNALDFDDLMLITVDLFTKNPEILQKYHNRFKHILVDEFQDTNLTQYKLINLLYTAGNEIPQEQNRSLCVVGDVDQSIYSWRGADYKIILNFQRDFSDAKLIKLEQNYRSTGSILDVANAIIMNNNERLSKNLYSNKGKGEKVSCYEANDEAEEANFIANKVMSMTGGRKNYNRFAVLYRTNAQSRAIEEAFMARGIPYKIIGGFKFYERKEIKDMVAYLKLVYNPVDNQSLKRVINEPKRSIGATTIKKLEDAAMEHSISMFSVIDNIEAYSEFNSKLQQKLKEFASIVNNAANRQRELKLSEFVAEYIEKTGYIAALKEENTEEAEARIENIQEFINVTREFEEIETENMLGEFLSQVALVSDVDDIDADAESVTLMTLHSAKGLEFSVVFLAGLEEGIFPHMRSLNSNSEMEEERRLMYVGVTRAEDVLNISYAKRRLMWGDYKYYSQSRFISEIPSHLLITNYSEAQYSSKHSSSTFRDAVKTRESKYGRHEENDYSVTFGKNFVAPKAQKKPSFDKPVAVADSFGKNFASPKTEQQAQQAKSSVQLIEKPQDEKNTAVQKQETTPPQEKTELLKAGDRVFHEKFGMGNIEQIIEVGVSGMYVVNFGKQGKKALDIDYAKLKKF
jgi:DNA helicase-2/ATP-dependent DNA helicase PcrA